MMVREKSGLLVEASSVITECLSAFEAKVKGLERAVIYASDNGWHNIIFSFDAATGVGDALSIELPKGWSTSESFLTINSKLKSCNWTLKWKCRTTKSLADALAKMSLFHFCNFMFSSNNLDIILKPLLAISASEIAGSLPSLWSPFGGPLLCLIALPF